MSMQSLIGILFVGWICVSIQGCGSASKAKELETEESAFSKAHTDQIASLNICFENEKSKNPSFKTELTYEALVDKTGRAKSVKILSSTVNNQNFEKCVAEKMLFWEYPIHSPPRPYKAIQSMKFESLSRQI